MSDDFDLSGMKETPIGVELRQLCERHEALIPVGVNEQAKAFLLLSATMEKLKTTFHPKTREEMVATIASLHDITDPLCCFIGEDEFTKLLRKLPLATGNVQTDEEVAVMLTGGQMERERKYPEPDEQSTSFEGGVYYVMSLGTAPSGDFLISVLSRVVDPQSQEAGLEVLDVEKHDDAKRARSWFRQLLNEKPWLREGSKPN